MSLQIRLDPIHWVGDAPTSLHGNGATSFNRTARESAMVTCVLCRTLLARAAPIDTSAQPAPPTHMTATAVGDGANSDG